MIASGYPQLSGPEGIELMKQQEETRLKRRTRSAGYEKGDEKKAALKEKTPRQVKEVLTISTWP